jgi:hypothetical protein
MATALFCLPAFTGLVLTGFALARFRRLHKPSAHQYALITSIGLLLTWLVSFFAPLLFPDFRIPPLGVVILGMVLATSTGVLSYGAVRLFFLLRGHTGNSMR